MRAKWLTSTQEALNSPARRSVAHTVVLHIPKQDDTRSLPEHQERALLNFVKKAKKCSRIRALFSGPSGTGKTLAAQFLAQKLKKRLYGIDIGRLSRSTSARPKKSCTACSIMLKRQVLFCTLMRRIPFLASGPKSRTVMSVTPADWTRAYAVVNYKQAVEPVLKTDRLSDSERAMLMGGACAKAYRWSPTKG